MSFSGFSVVAVSFLILMILAAPCFAHEGRIPPTPLTQPEDFGCMPVQEVQDIEMWLEHGAQRQTLGDEPDAERYTEKVKELANEYGKKVEKQNFCAATEEDIVCMIRLVEKLQLAGGGTGPDKIMAWTRKAYRAMAADVATFTNKPVRKILSKQARSLGDAGLASQVLSSDSVPSECKMRWRAMVNISYKCTQEGIKCDWGTTIQLPLVFLTGWRSNLGGYHPMGEYTSASTRGHHFEYHDGEKWIDCSKDRNIYWKLSVAPPHKMRPTGTTGKIPIILEYDPVRSKIHLPCSQGESGSPVPGVTGLIGPWEIPVDKVAAGLPFSAEFKESHSDGIAKVSFRFTPVNRDN